MQTSRIFLEYSTAQSNERKRQPTFAISALLIFALLKSGRSVSRSVLWAWNVWDSLCLVVITIVAVTTPLVVRLFGDEPRNLNTWVLYFPYVWLPVVLVTVAISSHIVITRRLMKGE